MTEIQQPAADSTNLSPLHSLLLQQSPLTKTTVLYTPKRFHRKRPRTLYTYPHRTYAIYDPLSQKVDKIFQHEANKPEEEIVPRKKGFSFGRSGGKVVLSKENRGEVLEGLFGKSVESDGECCEKWKFVKKIGHGSGGSVWLATYSEDDESRLAVKVVDKDVLNEGENALRRAVEERKAMEIVMRGGRNDCVVGLEGAWQSERRLYMAMRWFGMGDLGRVARGRKLGEDVVRGVISEVILGLEELRELGYVHRDLKLENCLVDENGHVAIGDLGMIKYIGGNTKDGYVGRTRSFCGTRSSMAPEMVSGHAYGYSVDMWGLGIMLYRLLTGRLPFGRRNAKHGNGGAIASLSLFHEIKTAPIKYPSYLSDDAKSLLKGLFDRYVGDRLDLDEVKQHAWFKDIDWEQVKESAHLRRKVPYLKEFLADVVPLVDEPGTSSTSNCAIEMSNVTVCCAEEEEGEGYIPQKQAMKRESRLSPWVSGRLFFNKQKSSTQCSRMKQEPRKENLKIWGYEYRPLCDMSTISTASCGSRCQSLE